jgi:glycosyltransferase involved in cell wall biosynthesis
MPRLFRRPRPTPASPASRAGDLPIIYLAGPCGGTTGGMYQVSVYLKQASSTAGPVGAELRLLDTRGPGAAIWSVFYVLAAAFRIAVARAAGRLAGVHIHVAERLSLMRKGLLVALCKLLGVPVVLHLHAAELEQNYAALPKAVQALVRAMFRLPDCCIALGQAAALFLQTEMGVPRQRIEVITNGVPDPSAHRRRERADGCFHILFVGNLSERKGVPVLLRALAHPRLSDVPVRLTLAGRGDIAGYESLARTLGVGGKVHFTGWAGKSTIDQLLAHADVFVLPSFNEGLPLAILEALASGVPAVCTPVGEIPQVLEHGRSAWFVEPGDADGLAAALQELAGDPDKRMLLSREGRAAYEARFSLEAFARAIASIHLRHFGVSAMGQESPAPASDPASAEAQLPDDREHTDQAHLPGAWQQA